MKTAQRRYVVDDKGKKQVVIVPLSQYRRMMEDLHDLAVVAERRNEHAISLKKMRHRLKSRLAGV